MEGDGVKGEGVEGDGVKGEGVEGGWWCERRGCGR